MSGTATSGRDYARLPGKVTIPVDRAFTTIELKPIDNKIREGDETVAVSLKAGAAYTVGASNSAVVTIKDKD